MDHRTFLDILSVAERLKNTTRHSWTSAGRHESVAEHSWRVSLMAYFLRDEFPEINMDKVIQMLLIHDLGEAFTGDIPAFDKTAAHEVEEETLFYSWVDSLPKPYAAEMHALYEEMGALETPEAKLYKALDNMEAVIQHNEAPFSTWIPREYELNLTYGTDKVAFSPWLTELRRITREEGEEKIKTGK
ncbi:MAG: HD domain-containing protein [Clostridiales bacterium]|nr:HD domain-containing protein [Clostridiales bacterium]